MCGRTEKDIDEIEVKTEPETGDERERKIRKRIENKNDIDAKGRKKLGKQKKLRADKDRNKRARKERKRRDLRKRNIQTSPSQSKVR